MRAISAIIGIFFLALSAYYALTPKTLRQPVVYDEASIFTPENIAQAETYQRHLLKNWRIDFRVLSTNDAGDINLLSAKKFKELEVGAGTQAGRGLLFTVNPAQDKVRLEVSAALEGVYTDAFISYIERNMMVPYFQGDMVNEGILAATELFVTRAQEAEKGINFDSQKMASFTTGAGAVTKARIGERQAPQAAEAGAVVPVNNDVTPEEAVDALLAMLAESRMVYDPLLFTKESVELFAKIPMPPAAVRTMYTSYSSCVVDAVKIAEQVAVVRFRPKDRKCGPFLFLKEDGRWKFDLIAIRNLITYDFQNEWGLKRDGSEAYHFAFTDWNMRDAGKFLVPRL